MCVYTLLCNANRIVLYRNQFACLESYLIYESLRIVDSEIGQNEKFVHQREDHSLRCEW